MLRAFLESEGIAASVRDANTVTADWMLSNAIGGVKVDVPDADVSRARELIAQFASGSPATEEKRAKHGIGRYVKIAAVLSVAMLLLIYFTVGFRGDMRPELLVISSFGIGICVAAACAMYDI